MEWVATAASFLTSGALLAASPGVMMIGVLMAYAAGEPMIAAAGLLSSAALGAGGCLALIDCLKDLRNGARADGNAMR